MVGVTKGLRRVIGLILIFYFLAALTAIIVSVYFIFTPFKRRQIVISTEQILVALSIGITMAFSSIFVLVGLLSQKVGSKALKIFNVLVTSCLLTTLSLGAYVWFQSLDIQQNYYSRWQSWPDSTRELFQEQGNCCGYQDSTNFPAVSNTCPTDVIETGSLSGCEAIIFLFVSSYLSNIYTTLFGYTLIDFTSLMGSLVLIKALEDQRRYEKSMRKMIHLHQIDNSELQPISDENRLGARDTLNHRGHTHTLSQLLTLPPPGDKRSSFTVYQSPNNYI